jgi:phosphatidylserine/phosphatidylglycerophosphate/cardiolipin synthase-like enzyme
MWLRVRIAVLILLGIFSLSGHAADLLVNNVPVRVLFSPNGGCTDAIVKEINSAQSEVLVLACYFSSTQMAKALVDAHKRGVKVQAVLDKSQRTANYSLATFLANSKVPTFIDDVHNIQHNKVMVIDGGTVITGSFNFTKNAENDNAENLMILKLCLRISIATQAYAWTNEIRGKIHRTDLIQLRNVLTSEHFNSP